MLSLPRELADPVEQLRATLLRANGSEQTCMTNAVVSEAHDTNRLPEVQAIMARCRQGSAAAATTVIDTFRKECFELGTQATSSAKTALLAATGVFHSVNDLITAIEDYLEANNDNPKPFDWTATAEQILAKIARGRVALQQA